MVRLNVLSKKVCKLFFLTFFLSCLVLVFNKSIFASMSSTNYAVENFGFSASSVSASSSNYALAEGVLDWIAKDEASSTNYEVEGQIGGAGLYLVPEIRSVSPVNLATFFDDETAQFTVTATDPDSDSLEYQLKVDGAVEVAYQSSNTLSWTLASSDKGRHALTFEVRDGEDGTVQSTQDTYVFYRPEK